MYNIYQNVVSFVKINVSLKCILCFQFDFITLSTLTLIKLLFSVATFIIRSNDGTI